MQSRSHSRPKTSYLSVANQPYQTTYKREYVARRPPSAIEDAPSGQRFLIGSPYQLTDPVDSSSYRMDFSAPKMLYRQASLRSQSTKIDLIPGTQRTENPNPSSSREIKQALRNQLNSTYQTDFVGAAQGFPLLLAYDRPRPHWRDRSRYSLASEHRHAYQEHPTSASFFGGRYAFSSRVPADAIVPLTLPLWRERSSQSIYTHEIGNRMPSDLYMKGFVDSLGGPIRS